MAASNRETRDFPTQHSAARAKSTPSYSSTAAGVRSSVQFRSMGFDAQSAYLSPTGRAQVVQREEAPVAEAPVAEAPVAEAPVAEAPSGELSESGAGEAEELKATAESLNGTIAFPEVQAVIQAASSRLQAGITQDFKGTVQFRIGPGGTAKSVEIPSFTPARDFKACAHVKEVLMGLKYPLPTPEGRSAAFSLPISIPALKQK